MYSRTAAAHYNIAAAEAEYRIPGKRKYCHRTACYISDIFSYLVSFIHDFDLHPLIGMDVFTYILLYHILF